MRSPQNRPGTALIKRLMSAMLVLGLATPAWAAEGLEGAQLSVLWALPFAGLLLCIATGPVFFHHVWEHNYGKISAFWAALTLLPLALVYGPNLALEQALHALLLEYVSFIVLLFALFTTAGGLLITGNLRGTPALNTGILAIGTVLASIVGTTGASMILIRPLIRANDNRRSSVHVVVFFIFLVSNIGGSLTPLGDPPLFLGFLRGVSFWWTTTHLLLPTLFLAGVLLALFFVLDSYLMRKEAALAPLPDKTPPRDLKLHGMVNLVLLAAIIGVILASAAWQPGVRMAFPGGTLELQNIVRDVMLLVIAALSLLLTPRPVRAGNDFSWGPIAEVAKLFAGIFLTMIPVLAMLKAGKAGVFGPLVALVSHADGSANVPAYFWLTGILSSFLDNAPTYLVFFELAGGDAKVLMSTGAAVLAAISGGAVFMGANTYIGNAPNFMVYAIAKDRGINMPSFFGYMLWSGVILSPVFLLTGYLFFR
jgi:Na+/H+ antiporter NhaD/arsenite permease-like protein